VLSLDAKIEMMHDRMPPEINPPTARAVVKLRQRLQRCWENCFPEDVEAKKCLRPEPTEFFKPFRRYGVALYRIRAKALLAEHLDYAGYSDQLNFALKEEICELIAPCRDTAIRDPNGPPLTQSEWQRHMARSWENFNHPDHSALTAVAKELINVLEDPAGGPHSMFVESLYKALSREALPLLGRTAVVRQAKRKDDQRFDPRPIPIDKGNGVTASPSDANGAVPSVAPTSPPFKNRAAWLNDRLRERGWSPSDPSRCHGPDRKTVEKILRGELVTNYVLLKLASALSLQNKYPKVGPLDIPEN
jgi:hypothetical protein